MTTWFISFVSNQLWFTSWLLWSTGAHLQHYSIKLQKTVIPLWEYSLTPVCIGYMTCRWKIVSLSDCKSRFSFYALLPYVWLKCWALWHSGHINRPYYFTNIHSIFLYKEHQVTRCGLQFRQFEKVQHLMVIYHMWCMLYCLSLCLLLRRSFVSECYVGWNGTRRVSFITQHHMDWVTTKVGLCTVRRKLCRYARQFFELWLQNVYCKYNLYFAFLYVYLVYILHLSKYKMRIFFIFPHLKNGYLVIPLKFKNVLVRYLSDNCRLCMGVFVYLGKCSIHPVCVLYFSYKTYSKQWAGIAKSI